MSEREQLIVALAQCKHPSSGDVVALVRAWVARAKVAGAQMVVFPEYLMTPLECTPEEFRERAESVHGEFVGAVCDIAREADLWIVFTMNEENPEGGRPYNTAVIADNTGKVRGTYRKSHLFDALGFSESEKMCAGDTLFAPIDTPWGRLGLGICYDLRFPEVARTQALQGCDVLLYLSGWVAGKNKVEQFHTLLGARAIENTMYVAGINRPDEGYAGGSVIVGPRGEVLAGAGAEEELVVATLDFADLDLAREQTPVLRQRREALYG